ncbi:MAG: hypothetical protein R3D02_05400 [Hyphomicrobiales bacterium]
MKMAISAKPRQKSTAFGSRTAAPRLGKLDDICDTPAALHQRPTHQASARPHGHSRFPRSKNLKFCQNDVGAI